ncbi:MAG TPA: TRAP transporter small permease [Burkholderiales bacterium]
MEKAYALWRAFQDRLLAPAAALLLLGCTLLALLEVVRRYVFGVSYEWQQDAVTYFILTSVFLYFGISQRRGTHLVVDIFLHTLRAVGPRARRLVEYLEVAATLIALLFMLGVVWWGLEEVLESQRDAPRTESLEFLLAPFLWALLIGFAFMVVSLFFQCWRGIQKLRGVSVLEEPAEGSHDLVD